MVRLSVVRRVAAIVSSSWLRNAMATSKASVTVLETEWKTNVDDFNSCHIHGAQPYELARCVEPTPENPRPLPALPCFEKYMQELGVHRDQHVILYGRGSMLFAARAWWTLRMFGHQKVSVLDGSLQKWQDDELPVEEGIAAAVTAGNFTAAKINTDLVATFNDMLRFGKDGSSQILDARNPNFYEGSGEEPAKPTVVAFEGAKLPLPITMQSGHVPGALNMREDDVTDPDTTCLLADAELAKVFASRQIDLHHPLTTMCYNGFAACLLALAAAKLNKADVAVYDGSWTEYGQLANSEQVEKAEGRPPPAA